MTLTWQDFVIGGGLIFVFTFLITWGAVRAKSQDHERRIEKLEDESARQLELIHSLRDVYVSYQHFNEIMQTIREANKDLNDKVSKVIELLTDRP